jgi:hypothetical protein
MTLDEYKARAKQDLDNAFEKGKSQGGGGDGYYDTFWDGFQNYGNRTNYSGFADTTPHNGWFRPKYDIKPTMAESFMRNYGQNLSKDKYVDLVALLNELGITIDFSKCTNITYIFYNARIWHLPEINVTGAGDSATNQLLFGGYVRKIDKFVCKESQLLQKTFSYCSDLEQIEVEGVIGKNLDMHWSTKLFAESYHSIITHCSKTASFTLTLPPEATVRSVYDTKYGSGAWDSITAEYPNVTIAYM